MSIATIEPMDARRFPRWAIWVTVIALMLLTLYGAWRIGLRRAIARELAAMKAAGYPTTLRERDAWYKFPPPEGKNAATEILSAAGMIQEADKVFGDAKADARVWIAAGLYEPHGRIDTNQPVMIEKRELVPPSFSVGALSDPMSQIPAPCLEMIEEYVAPNRPAIARLAEAAKLPDARYPADFSRDPLAIVPGVGMVRTANHLLGTEALIAIERGDADRAIEMIEASAGLANSLRDVPAVVEQLVRYGCLDVAVKMSERLACLVKMNDGQLRRLMAALGGARGGLDLERALAGETAGTSEALLHFEKLGEVSWIQEMKARGSGLADLMGLHYLQTMRQVVAIQKMPTEERLGELQKIYVQLEVHPTSNMPTRIIVPGYIRVVLLNLRTIARLRAAMTAMGIERYRLAHGDWPTDWKQFVPEYVSEATGIDPFTGGSLEVKMDEKRLLVYSVGEDLADNGGARVNGAGREFEAGADVVFVIGHRSMGNGE
ncbi:MAG: hypothetical protein ACYC26_12145 [Phycisphaerales bacterium]